MIYKNVTNGMYFNTETFRTAQGLKRNARIIEVEYCENITDAIYEQNIIEFSRITLDQFNDNNFIERIR